MSTGSATAEPYAYLWQESGYPSRWVIWDLAEEAMVFDREINCPVHIDDGAALAEVLRRMREAGVPESRDYPGRPCS
ncbi:hypothetical protein ACFWUW_08240 [Streptomyces sp. NPDC058655]|uniref:hypothetical protein n=1 Tax=unclassified Streptomyces TaxID=2593676 RepID=UPI0036607660